VNDGFFKKALQVVQLLPGQGRSREIGDAEGFVGRLQVLPNRLAESGSAGPVRICTPFKLSQASEGLMEGSGDAALRIDAEASECIWNPAVTEMLRLDQERSRMDDDRAGQHRDHLRLEGGGSELGEGVMAAIREHHIVASLSAAVEPHDGMRPPFSCKKVREMAFPAVSESQPED